MNDTTSSVVWTVAGILLAIQVANCYVNVCAKLGVSVMVPLRRAASALLRPLRTLRCRIGFVILGSLLWALWNLPRLAAALARDAAADAAALRADGWGEEAADACLRGELP